MGTTLAHGENAYFIDCAQSWPPESPIMRQFSPEKNEGLKVPDFFCPQKREERRKRNRKGEASDREWKSGALVQGQVGIFEW
jgi:hypothetical protein